MVTTRSRQPKIDESLNPKKRSASSSAGAEPPSKKNNKVQPAEERGKEDDVKPAKTAEVEPSGRAHSEKVKKAEKKLVGEKDVLEYGRIHFLYKPRVS